MHPDSGADILIVTAAAAVAFLGLLSLRGVVEAVRRVLLQRRMHPRP